MIQKNYENQTGLYILDFPKYFKVKTMHFKEFVTICFPFRQDLFEKSKTVNIFETICTATIRNSNIFLGNILIDMFNVRELKGCSFHNKISKKNLTVRPHCQQLCN